MGYAGSVADPANTRGLFGGKTVGLEQVFAASLEQTNDNSSLHQQVVLGTWRKTVNVQQARFETVASRLKCIAFLVGER